MSIKRVLAKTVFLFCLCNGLYLAIQPLNFLVELSLYNSLIAGRSRLPFSRDPASDYNLTLLDIDLMLATHEIAAAERDTYGVVLLGDSSVWGWQLAADQTLSACLNPMKLTTSRGQPIQVYNLGYPLLNITKDWLILDKVLAYNPDLVVWLITLESLYPEEQLWREIIQANRSQLFALLEEYPLALDKTQLDPSPSLWEHSLWGQRETLSAWFRLQRYGLAWQLTGVDHRDPAFFTPVRQNLQASTALLEVEQTEAWQPEDLALDVLAAGIQMAETSGIQVLLVNEPIYRSTGANSDLRYNFYYPRWAYDSYKDLIHRTSAENGWVYRDYGEIMPPEVFTDSSFHLNPAATCEFAAYLSVDILTLVEE